MRKQIQTCTFLVLLMTVTTLYSCNKNDTHVSPTVPSLSDVRFDLISTTAANFTSGITSTGNSSVTSVGFCWSLNQMPTIDSNKITTTLTNDTSFSVTVNGLKGGTYYYVRPFAVNGVGINYGKQVWFKTNGGLPQATTEGVVFRPGDTTILSGSVKSNELLTTVTFEYGETTSYGSTVAALENPWSGEGSVSAKLTGLVHNTTFHFRVKAENEKGVTFGEDKTFRVPDPDGTIGTMTDIEGNTYKTISIGGQIWMMENLRTTKFKDGTPIPNVTGIAEWGNLASPAYSWYGNNKDLYKGDLYGALYNWYAVNTGKLAPAGWHVPTEEEWQQFINYVNIQFGLVAGGLKEEGLMHWMWPNRGATNSSGFTALPAGARYESGFTFMGEQACWWTATPSSSPEYAFYHYVDRNSATIDTYNIINHRFKGFSVRCVKD